MRRISLFFIRSFKPSSISIVRKSEMKKYLAILNSLFISVNFIFFLLIKKHIYLQNIKFEILFGMFAFGKFSM